MTTAEASALGREEVVQRIQTRQERIHVAIGPVCNNNCIFCMEEDRVAREVVNGSMTPERVRRILEASAGSEEVCFTSGEPTMVAELPRYARWARRLGYRRVSVMTNGRRLSHAPYVEHLVKAGINFFYVSIHGHTQKLHSGLVREPAAFEQTVAGLDNVSAYKREGVTLHTSTVVTRRNAPYFAEIYRFLRSHGVDQVVFNVMQANGRAHTYFEQLFPKYTDIAAGFAAFLKDEPEQPAQAFLVDIPLCTTTNLPDFNRGYVERYLHYEPKGFQQLELGERDAPAPDDDLVAVTRADLDRSERLKRPECASCRYEPACEGVWKNYLARYGWDEMVPVPHPAAPDDAARATPT